MNKIYNHEESLRQRNELTKLKLQAEFGGKFSEEHDIDPVLENIFLNNVLQFEQAMAASIQVSVHQLIGEPSVKMSDDVSDDELSAALEDVMTLLNDKNIFIDSICGVTTREMYRFITQELFLQETESIMPPGMMKYYIYEEFHPNHENDAKSVSNDFIKALCDKESDFFHSMIWPGKNSKSRKDQDKLINQLNNFRDSFDSLIIEDFKITSVEMEEVLAIINFEYKINAFLTGCKVSQSISGKGNFVLILDGEWWSVKSVGMKGVV